MSKEYIERGALLEQAVKLPEYNTPMVSVYAIQAATAADVVEVKHGRWEKHIIDDLHNLYCGKCSDCDYELDYLIDADDYSYCPNCGAKMDGE